MSEMTADHVNLDALIPVIREAGRPVSIRVLALAALCAWMESRVGERHYAPGDEYVAGDVIRFNGELVEVKAVQDGENPVQGQFKILTLRFPDGTERYVAAGVAGAPTWKGETVSDQRVQGVYREDGLAVRTVVQKALDADERFVWFQDAQADQWCLAEMLPEVTKDHLSRVWSVLQGSLAEPGLHPGTTEGLVEEIWEQPNDGSDAYVLRAFALNVALQRCQDVRWMGDGWILEG